MKIKPNFTPIKIFAISISSIFSTYNVFKINNTKKNINQIQKENIQICNNIIELNKDINLINEELSYNLHLLGEETEA